ncbi:MAG: site-2 protease family protein, partial [Eubacteriaceae bacterium]|nr:site-2 protease family protein [Eubacteriaceae bacterium]
TTTLTKVSEGSPAMSAGIRPGDEITAINGTPIESWEDITDIIRGGTGQPLEIELIRENGQSETVTLTPLYDEQEKAYLIGITPVIKTNVIKAFGLSFYMVGYYIAALCNIFGDLFKGLVGLEIFSGPIGATAIIGQYINQGATVILTIAASIAVSLGFFNLLPLPALDGSRILFVLYEMIFKKPINRRVEAVIHTVGLMAMMLFGLFIAYRDIINLR